jgi:hypothetical protein
MLAKGERYMADDIQIPAKGEQIQIKGQTLQDLYLNSGWDWNLAGDGTDLVSEWAMKRIQTYLQLSKGSQGTNDSKSTT